MIGRLLLYAFCLAVLPWATLAQQPSAASRLTVSAGHLDVDGLPASGARLCVDREMLQCYQMASMEAPGSPDVVYQFGLDPAVTRLNVLGGGSWVLFSATYSGGGSGLLTRYAILRQQGIHFTDLLPPVALTAVSDHAVWNAAALSPRRARVCSSQARRALRAGRGATVRRSVSAPAG